MVYENIEPLDVEEILDSIPEFGPASLQSQVVLDRMETLKRVEHRFTINLGMNKVKREGLKTMVAHQEDFTFLKPTPLNPNSIFAKNMHLYNSGSLQHIHVPSTELSEAQIILQDWEELNVASSLLEFGFPQPPEEAELVPIKSTAKTPENVLCFSVETPGVGGKVRKSMNTFILARKSIHPLLCELDFHLISPLVSMLWADKSRGGLNSYYHFLGWCEHQESSTGATKYSLSDSRERSKTKCLPGAGMVVLHALILKTLEKPYDETLISALESIANILHPESSSDAGKIALLNYLGIQVGGQTESRPR